MQWRGKYDVARYLPMGCASSCKTFEALNTTMEWVARSKLAIPNIKHILDDFLLLEKSHEACTAGLQRFLHFCQDIDVPMAPEKTEGPYHVMTFAGMKKLTKSCRQSAICCPEKELIERAPIACRSLKFCLFGHHPWQSFYSATDEHHHWCQTCTSQYPSNQRN